MVDASHSDRIDLVPGWGETTLEPPPAAYCGAPPVPAELWLRWNLDPVLLLTLAACLVLYLLAGRRAGLHAGRRALFVAGWLASALALVSPLCSLSVALFSARVGQHMFLAAIAAPLVALGRPGLAVRALRRRDSSRGRGEGRGAYEPLLAAGAFAAVLWCWHTPGPYELTFKSTVVYWFMHLTLFGTALWLWSSLLDAADERLGAAIAAALLTGLQMSLLGAIITFAGRPLYAPHLLTTGAWGLSPMDDQQLGGVLMWVPAGVVFVGALVGGTAALLHRLERAPAVHQASRAQT
ncbi:MAG TPA: cytochrome c oxidase assembly protein [Myxococcales bacterium]